MVGAGLRSLTRPPATGPIHFTVDGHRMVLPHHPARWWVQTLSYKAPGCWWNIIPGGLARKDQAHLIMRLDDPDDPFDMDEIETLAEQVIERALGMSVWVAQRLMAAANSQWTQLEAWCIQQGAVGLLDGNPGRVASAVYAWRLAAAQNVGDEKKAKREMLKLEGEVWAPPPMHMHSGALRDMTPPGWQEAMI